MYKSTSSVEKVNLMTCVLDEAKAPELWELPDISVLFIRYTEQRVYTLHKQKKMTTRSHYPKAQPVPL